MSEISITDELQQPPMFIHPPPPIKNNFQWIEWFSLMAVVLSILWFPEMAPEHWAY
jgi:hypothetical protein